MWSLNVLSLSVLILIVLSLSVSQCLMSHSYFLLFPPLCSLLLPPLCSLLLPPSSLLLPPSSGAECEVEWIPNVSLVYRVIQYRTLLVQPYR